MEEQGETRKIQFTGKSSYIVSLPKQWIKELGLKQGDQIRMIRKGSSTLELYPPKFESRVQKKEDATIEIAEEEAFPSSGNVSSSGMIRKGVAIRNIRIASFIDLKISIIFIYQGIIIKYLVVNL